MNLFDILIPRTFSSSTMLLVGLIIVLSWITGHAGAIYRREQLHTGSQMVTWEAELKLKTTLVTEYGLLKLEGDHRTIVDLGEMFNFYCAAIETPILTYYGTKSELSLSSDTFPSINMWLNMNKGTIITPKYTYSLVDKNTEIFNNRTMEYLKRTSDKTLRLGQNRAHTYEAIDNSTLNVVTIGNDAIEAKFSNSTGIWEAVGILADQMPFRMRKNYFQVNFHTGHMIMETLTIDDWEPFFLADLGDYTASIASQVNVNVSYDSPTNTYNATIFTPFERLWMRDFYDHVIEPLANLIIDDAKMEAEIPKYWRLAYYYSRNSLSLRTKEEHMAVGANKLTLEIHNRSLAVRYNNDLDDVMISYYTDFDFHTDIPMMFNVYRDGLYVGNSRHQNILTYNRTANQITFKDMVESVVHEVKIDLTTKTMETIPLLAIQRMMTHNTTIYMPYEIQTGIKTSWTNWNQFSQINHILITEHFVDLRLSKIRLQLNRITGQVTTNVGVADWSADGSFSANFGDLRANVKPNAFDRRKVDWMDASGKYVSINLSPDGVMNAYYNDKYFYSCLHLQSNRNFTVLKFNQMVAKIIRKKTEKET